MTMGVSQSIEEKFDEIYKMDHTQYVIYVAKLFANRGYSIKLTPIVDNFGIDMVVEKGDKKSTLTCFNRREKLITANDLQLVLDGFKKYDAKSAIVVTSTYFDRSAVDFARQEHLSLIDRGLLAEDFMQ